MTTMDYVIGIGLVAPMAMLCLGRWIVIRRTLGLDDWLLAAALFAMLFAGMAKIGGVW